MDRMDKFPKSFTLVQLQDNMRNNAKLQSIACDLRALFHTKITEAACNGRRAVLVTMSELGEFPAFVRVMVTKELVDRFPHAVYALNLSVSFDEVDQNGSDSNEILVVLEDPNPNPRGRISMAEVTTLCALTIMD